MQLWTLKAGLLSNNGNRQFLLQEGTTVSTSIPEHKKWGVGNIRQVDGSERTNATRRKEADEGLSRPYLEVDTLHMWQKRALPPFFQ